MLFGATSDFGIDLGNWEKPQNCSLERLGDYGFHYAKWEAFIKKCFPFLFLSLRILRDFTD
jgi:hypothetical protein